MVLSWGVEWIELRSCGLVESWFVMGGVILMGLIPVWCVGSLRLVAVLGVVVGGLLLLGLCVGLDVGSSF